MVGQQFKNRGRKQIGLPASSALLFKSMHFVHINATLTSFRKSEAILGCRVSDFMRKHPGRLTAATPTYWCSLLTMRGRGWGYRMRCATVFATLKHCSTHQVLLQLDYRFHANCIPQTETRKKKYYALSSCHSDPALPLSGSYAPWQAAWLGL